MSVQSAKDFLQKIETDQALKARLEAAPDVESRQQIVQEAGFDFTLAEFRQVVDEVTRAAGKQLTPEELELVTGGLGKGHCAPGYSYGYANRDLIK